LRKALHVSRKDDVMANAQGNNSAMGLREEGGLPPSKSSVRKKAAKERRAKESERCELN
jgi:hypothetical protein